MKLMLTLVSAIVLMAASCNDTVNATLEPLSATNVAGSYKLVEPSSKYSVTLILTPDSASVEVTGRIAYRVTGRSAVNQYFGSLTGSAASNEIQISALGSTKMAGPEDAMQFETDYFNKLQAAKRYEITGNRLRLLTDSNNALVYEKEK
ncbi:META domain-containing protein [Larkinella sp. VNQ87]|uniref:META domain-containing protein n=1 Tax=Larkinella sp. VNQ87 TaxID=3400921 RepID=UPI003C00BC28